LAKVQLRPFALDAASGLLGGVHFEFGFLGYYGGLTGFFVSYQTGYGAEVSAGADYYAGADFVIPDPIRAGALQAG
jgi:hypothetical protein